jgi:hypothetical protein
MAALLPVAEHSLVFQQNTYKFSKIAYDGTTVTFKVDQSAIAANAVLPASGTPTVTISDSDSDFERTVSLANGAPAGTVVIVTTHTGTAAGTQR